ncbi:MAG: transporter substrate-binding domain-containing protein [Eubacteriaceae bacterium]|nr:transporter substrate-binding domain-containing protein [Eubacteriaceae bacterium]
MRKILALILCALFLLPFAMGCTKPKDQGDTPGDEPQGENPWDAARGKEYLVGTDTTFAPFEFEDDDGTHTGIDIVLLDAIAEEMGFIVNWDVLGFTAAVAALEASQVDAVMAGMSITDERKLKYDFTDAYYSAGIGVAVKNDAEFASIEDLRGKRVVTKNSTTSAAYAEDIKEEYDFETIQVDESAVMYTYVESGQADACFDDNPVLLFEIARGNIQLKVIHEADISFPSAMAVLKTKNPELIAAFNEGLARLQANGKYQEILDRFFK